MVESTVPEGNKYYTGSAEQLAALLQKQNTTSALNFCCSLTSNSDSSLPIYKWAKSWNSTMCLENRDTK